MRKLFAIAAAAAFVLQGAALADASLNGNWTKLPQGSYHEEGIISGGAWVPDSTSQSGPEFTVGADIQSRVFATASGYQLGWNIGDVKNATDSELTQTFDANVWSNCGSAVMYGFLFPGAPKVMGAKDSSGWEGQVYTGAMVSGSNSFSVKIGGAWNSGAYSAGVASANSMFWILPGVGDQTLHVKVKLLPAATQAPGTYALDPILVVKPAI